MTSRLVTLPELMGYEKDISYGEQNVNDFMDGVIYNSIGKKKENSWKRGDFSFEKRELHCTFLTFLFNYITKKRMWRQLDKIKIKDIDPILMKGGMICMRAINDNWNNFVLDYRMGEIKLI